MELSLVNIFIVIAIVIFGGSAIAFIIARLYIHCNKSQVEICDNLDISLKEVVQYKFEMNNEMRKNHEFVDGIKFIDKLNEVSDSLEQYKKQHSYSITNQYNGG